MDTAQLLVALWSIGMAVPFVALILGALYKLLE
jgi:hypothetical protein